jgi:tetratricopeptide (TPR) repeat protein
MRKLFFILSIIVSQFAFGQQREIDSLKNLLKTDKKDTTKLIHLYGISDLSETISNYPDGIKYGNKAIALANVLIKNSKNKIIKRTANYYKAKAYTNIGIVYEHQGSYPEALKNHFASLKIGEEIVGKQGVAASYNNIGIVYYRQRNYPEALRNYFAALTIGEEIGDNHGMASSYNNIGSIYSDLGDYPEAMKNFYASLKIAETIDNKYLFAISYINLGAINLKLKKISEAKKYWINGLYISKEIGANDLTRDYYKGLAHVDSIVGDYKSQVANYKLYILYRDSIDNEETRKQTIQSQMTYDFEKKEAVAAAEHKTELKNQAKIAEEKNRKQKLVTYFVIGGLFLVLIFAVFVFRSLRITRKQKVLIEKQKIAVEQHQKEIIDSIYYAKRIQTALLPSNKNIEKNINRLRKG